MFSQGPSDSGGASGDRGGGSKKRIVPEKIDPRAPEVSPQRPTQRRALRRREETSSDDDDEHALDLGTGDGAQITLAPCGEAVLEHPALDRDDDRDPTLDRELAVIRAHNDARLATYRAGQIATGKGASAYVAALHNGGGRDAWFVDMDTLESVGLAAAAPYGRYRDIVMPGIRAAAAAAASDTADLLRQNTYVAGIVAADGDEKTLWNAMSAADRADLLDFIVAPGVSTAKTTAQINVRTAIAAEALEYNFSDDDDTDDDILDPDEEAEVDDDNDAAVDIMAEEVREGCWGIAPRGMSGFRRSIETWKDSKLAQDPDKPRTRWADAEEAVIRSEVEERGKELGKDSGDFSWIGDPDVRGPHLVTKIAQRFQGTRTAEAVFAKIKRMYFPTKK